MASMLAVNALRHADDLLALLALARTGSPALAAQELAVGSSTIRRRIRRLEDQVGQRLFERTPGGWHPTKAGRHLVSYAEDVDQTLVDASAALTRRAAEPLRGKVRLLTPEGFGTFLAPWALRETARRHPELEIEIYTFTHRLPLAARTYDIAVSLEEPDVRGIDSARLCNYSLGLFATADYRAHHPVHDLADLEQQRFVYYLDAHLDVEPLRVLSQLVPKLGAQYQANSVSAQAQIVLAGLGIGLLPRYLTGFHPELIPVLPEVVSFEQQYWIGVPSQASGAPHVTQVAADIRDAFSFQDLDRLGPELLPAHRRERTP